MKQTTKKKNVFIIIIVLTIIMIMGIGTYALVQWTSTENTELTLRIGETSGLMCSKENDITVSNMGPVFDYEQDGEITEFTVLNLTGTSTNMSATLKVNTITDNLKRSDFKYVVMYSEDEVNYFKLSEGSFSNVSSGEQIELFVEQEISGNIYYKVIFYIDGNMENSIDMQNGSLIGTIYFCGDIPELETISNTIIALSNDESCAAGGRGVCATDSYDGTDYRYRGAEVDNFVSFNGDMYRIIGVFDENTHGVTGEYLVKLIQANVSYNYSWGGYNSSATSGTYYDYKNDWTGNTTGIKSNANVLLNEYFYNKTNTSSTYGVCTNWTYYSSDTNYRTNDCSNIVGYGIDSSFRNYIEDVTWYLKGYNGSEYSKQNFYLCERGITTDTTNCMSGNSGAYNVSITGKIGLMYVSDYMYASGYYSTLDITTASSYYYGNNNWLFQGDEWTITPQADSDGRVFYFDDTGDVYTYNSVNAIGFRPTFYLKSTIKVSGGDGTFENPYTLIL